MSERLYYLSYMGKNTPLTYANVFGKKIHSLQTVILSAQLEM